MSTVPPSASAARMESFTTYGILDEAINLLDAHGDSRTAEAIRRSKRIIPNVPVSRPLNWEAAAPSHGASRLEQARTLFARIQDAAWYRISSYDSLKADIDAWLNGSPPANELTPLSDKARAERMPTSVESLVGALQDKVEIPQGRTRTVEAQRSSTAASDDAKVLSDQRDNLAMLVRLLVQKVRRDHPEGSDLADRAMSYLCSKGLQGSITRGDVSAIGARKIGEWIEWSGGDCPVRTDDMIEYRLGNGEVFTQRACYLDWRHSGYNDIVAYRHSTERGSA